MKTKTIEQAQADLYAAKIKCLRAESQLHAARKSLIDAELELSLANIQAEQDGIKTD